MGHQKWRLILFWPTSSAEPRRISEVAVGTEIRTERWHSMPGARVKFSWNPPEKNKLGLKQFEIDLAPKRINPHHSNAKIVAKAKFFAVAAAFDDVFLFVIVVV